MGATVKKPRVAFTTLLAGILTILISLPYLALAVVLVAGSIVGRSNQEVQDTINQFEGLNELANAATVLLVFIGVVVFFVSLWVFLLGWKVLRRRGWARWMLAFTSFIFLIVWVGLLMISMQGLQTQGEQISLNSEQLLVPVVMVVVLALIFLLLVLPPTSNDFRRAREYNYPAVAAANAATQLPPTATTPPPAEPPSSSEQPKS